MRIKKAMLVFRKDWREISRNWQVMLPIILVPLLISVFIPVILNVIPSLVNPLGTSLNGLEDMIQNLPQHIQAELAGMTNNQVMVYVMQLYFFAPFFLIIPLMTSSVIASDSFAGEKERKTIEGLLATPLSDSELLFGKMLVSFVPSMIITFISFSIYSLTVDLFSFTIFNGKLLLPNLDWILLIFGLAPTLALASIGLTVMISAKVKGFKEAQQISAILVIPILAMVFAQITGAIIFGALMASVLLGIFAIVDVIVFKLAIKIFKREEILSKLA